MPSKLFESIGLSKHAAYGIHMAMYGSPILMFFETFIFNDWNFAVSLFLLITLDTAVGGVAHILNRDFSGQIFYKKLAKKLFAIVMTILSIGVLKNAVISGNQNVLSSWIDASLYAVMMGFEGASILKNTYKIYPWEPIKLALKRLEIYYDNQKNRVIDADNK